MKKITLLVLFMIGSIASSFGQALSEDFEVWPPAGWTIETTNPDATWEPLEDALNGTSAFVPWDLDQDESLISPSFNVPTGAPVLEFTMAMGYEFGVDPNNNYDFIVSVSDDGGTTWTAIWDESELGVFDDYEIIDVEVPLTAYAGTDIMIKFQYLGNDGDILALDDVLVAIPPAAAPDCVTLTAPADAATGVVYWSPVELTWDAAAAGEPAASYDVYLDTNAAPTTLLGNQVELTRNVSGLLASTTYYWKVVAKNAAGEATGCSVFSFTTAANPFTPYCGPITFTNNVEPITLVNFAGINNATSATLNGTPGHEDFTAITGSVTAGTAYTITLKGNTDGTIFTNRFMVFADWNQDGDFADTDEAYTITQTITGSTGVDAVQATQSLQVPPSATPGTTRMRVKKIFGVVDYTDPCLGTGFGQVEEYTLNVTAAPTDAPDYVSLQWPVTATITQTQTATVYGQVYEAGLTDVAPNIAGQAPGITAWVGYSTTNTNPNTWTNWTPATWNAGHESNNDEYQAAIGATLAPGTYYYATRFQLNGGPYAYGGINPSNNNGNFWDGTTYVNGVLTVNAPLPPANDECGGAIALVPGGVFANNAVSGNMYAATLTAGLTPTCQTSNIADVWYTVEVPASGSITIETQTNATNSLADTVVAAFSGACGSLTQVGCNDDGGPTGPNDLMSILSLTGRTPGETLYIGVWKYGTVAPTATVREFMISAYDASLSTGSFDSANFEYHPNPVTNSLNLSYNKEISNVDVFNLLGQKVISKVINANETQVDMSNLAKGAYTVKVTSDNQIKTIKIIKQ